MLAEGIQRLADTISRMLSEETNSRYSTKRPASQEEDAKALW